MFGKDKKKENMYVDLGQDLIGLGDRIVKLEEKVKELELRLDRRKEEPDTRKPIKGEFVSVITGFTSDLDFDHFRNICSDIATKDETFNFDTNEETKEVEIYHNDKDELHKKSLWLINRTEISGLKYAVRQI